MSSSEEKVENKEKDNNKKEDKEENNEKDNKKEHKEENKEKNNKKEHKEEKGNKEEKEKGSKEEKEKEKGKGKSKQKEKEKDKGKEDKEEESEGEEDSKEKDSKEKDNKKSKTKNTKKEPKKKVTKPKVEKKKPEPKTLHFKSWSIAMEDGGLFINGIVKEDKEEVEYHTAPIASVKDSHEVTDKEGNTIILKGKINREDSLNSGLSESFVDLFKDGFFSKNFKTLVTKEKTALLQRIRMRTIDWHDLAFVGIELKGLKDIYKEPFEFPDLERELTEGILSRQEYPLYCFMASQPLYLGGVGSSTRILQVPYIVVIDCEVPPPNKIGYHSVQLGINKVIDFKKQKSFATFNWEPYIPSRIREDSKLPKPMIYHLKWTVRSSKMNGFNEKDQHYIEYLLPYIELPQLIEEEKKPEDSDTTQVSFKWKYDKKYYDIVFDKEIDRTATFIPEFLEDNKLKGKVEEEEVKKALQEEFKRVREKKLKEWESKQKLVENMTEKQREALRNIKIYKFYPSHPEIRKPEEISNPKINQYFGNADKVFVPEPPEIDEKKLKKMQEAALKKQEQEEKRRLAEEKRRSPKRRKRKSPSPSPSPKKKTTTNKRRKKDESSEEMSDEESESSEKKSSKKKKSTPTKKRSSPKKKKQDSSDSDESQSVEDSDNSDDSSEPKKKSSSSKKKSTPTKKKTSTPTKKSNKKNK